MEREKCKKDFIETCNTNLYQIFRGKIATADFELEDGEKWHKAELVSNSIIAKACIVPDEEVHMNNEAVLNELQESMRSKVQDLAKHGDLAVDVIDIIIGKWLKEANHFEAMIDITADDFLEARGIKKKVNSSGRRGGYTKSQRRDIQEMIDCLSSIWIKVTEMDVIQVINDKRKKEKWRGEGKAIVLSSRMGKVNDDGSIDSFAWRVRPGDMFAKFLFGVGRQTALLSQKALNYDPYRQKWEKRLTRYFAYLWRVSLSRTKEGLLVKTLIKNAGMEIDKSRPKRTLDRLEDALNRLKKDGVITDWKYENPSVCELRKRGWWREWLNQKVIITAPAEIIGQYESIKARRNS